MHSYEHFLTPNSKDVYGFLYFTGVAETWLFRARSCADHWPRAGHPAVPLQLPALVMGPGFAVVPFQS